MTLCIRHGVMTIDRFWELSPNGMIHGRCSSMPNLASRDEKHHIVVRNVSDQYREDQYVSDGVPPLPMMSQFRGQGVWVNNSCTFVPTSAKLSVYVLWVVCILLSNIGGILICLCEDMLLSVRWACRRTRSTKVTSVLLLETYKTFSD